MKRNLRNAVALSLALSMTVSQFGCGAESFSEVVQPTAEPSTGNDGSMQIVTDIPAPADPNGTVFKGEE